MYISIIYASLETSCPISLILFCCISSCLDIVCMKENFNHAHSYAYFCRYIFNSYKPDRFFWFVLCCVNNYQDKVPKRQNFNPRPLLRPLFCHMYEPRPAMGYIYIHISSKSSLTIIFIIESLNDFYFLQSFFYRFYLNYRETKSKLIKPLRYNKGQNFRW